MPDLNINILTRTYICIGWVKEGSEIFDQDENGQIAEHEVRYTFTEDHHNFQWSKNKNILLENTKPSICVLVHFDIYSFSNFERPTDQISHMLNSCTSISEIFTKKIQLSNFNRSRENHYSKALRTDRHTKGIIEKADY